jgi:hypothetical protein
VSEEITMYEINMREFKRSLSLLSSLGKERHPEPCVTDESPIRFTVDLMGNFILESPCGFTFGTDVTEDEMSAPFTAMVAYKHLKVINMLAYIKNTIEVDLNDSANEVTFRVNGKTVYRFQTAAAMA